MNVNLDEMSYVELVELEKKIKVAKEKIYAPVFKSMLSEKRIWDLIKDRFKETKYMDDIEHFDDGNCPYIVLDAVTRLKKAMLTISDITLGNYEESYSKKSGKHHRALHMNGSFISVDPHLYKEFYGKLQELITEYGTKVNTNKGD